MTEEKTRRKHESGLQSGDVVKIERNGKIETDVICGFSHARLFDRRESSDIAILQQFGFVPLDKINRKT